jgi:hypothetical protein
MMPRSQPVHPGLGALGEQDLVEFCIIDGTPGYLAVSVLHPWPIRRTRLLSRSANLAQGSLSGKRDDGLTSLSNCLRSSGETASGADLTLPSISTIATPPRLSHAGRHKSQEDFGISTTEEWPYVLIHFVHIDQTAHKKPPGIAYQSR